MMNIARALVLAVIAAVWVSQADADPRDVGGRIRDAIAERQGDAAQNDYENFRGRNHNNVRDDNQDGNDDARGRGRGPVVFDRDRSFDRDRGPDHDRARQGVAAGRLLPLEVVLANVARSLPGHHIGVDGPYQQGGRWVYRIKWLTPDGRVIIVIADAETGQILGTRGG